MFLPLLVVPIASIAALLTAFALYKWISRQDPGQENIVRIAGYIREGAIAYLKQQYKTSGIFFGVAFLLLLYVSYGLKSLSGYVPFAFLTGAFFSGLSGFLGMLTSTYTSSRTTNAARFRLNDALRISFRGGSVMGLVVVGFGLLDIVTWFLILNKFIDVPNLDEKLHIITTTMLSFGFGASSQALFARVGGGIFTKAADMGADLVGKVEAGIPEDDPRNPAVIADNVGDNVGDIAGMGADLYESFVGSILGTAALSVSAGYSLKGVILPMIIAAIGTLSSIIGVFSVKTKEDTSQKQLLKAVNIGMNLTTILTLIFSIITIYLLLPGAFWRLLLPIVAGLAVGVALAYTTDYFTNAAYRPVHIIAGQAKTGHATVITSGLSVGLMSTAPSILFVALGTILSFALGGGFSDLSAGLYAVGLASVGMLSTLGINLATDAFGPIADNAGGLAEMAELPAETRRRTDALDELGNSTAARGKGLSIGAAALTAVTLIAAFIEEIRGAMINMGIKIIEIGDKVVDVVNATVIDIIDYLGGSIMDIRFIIGLFIGGAIIATFASMTTQAVSKAAGEMIEEVRRQFREIKGVMTGETTPDYGKCVQISTLAAQKKMIAPALVVILTPILTGLILGPIAIIGLLLGNLVVGFIFAIFMANSGGAWDNAKKFIERSKSELKDIIKEGIKKVSRRGLWPFFLTKEYNRFLFELVNLNPIAFSIDEEVSEYLAEAIDYIEKEYFVKNKDINEIIRKIEEDRNNPEFDDEQLKLAYRKLNQDDRLMFVEYLKLAKEDKTFLMEMKDVKEKFTSIMNSYSAAVTGDTVGDPLKDTSGPSLNIAIKLATMVSIITIGLVMRYNISDILFK
ncbi:MAG: sodium-translocating pyrophosphatase [Candidatus Neomarinimicrobiota bacterium]|nr:sodium-translocating pyrophosphatase [Candidatus Neomarinimicrobiota bacterium]RKY52629.1 MAG: sodium-translocating pyrophosphatase [Candidatus Neomarinimicrobiota bacterium]HDN59065.1 sodium-translocating pyrophosphatase [Candidatus Neomarinimicrobiota bacterium]